MLPAYKLDWPALEGVLPGFMEVRRQWPERFSDEGRVVSWVCKEEEGGKLHIEVLGAQEASEDNEAAEALLVTYSRQADAYRALGILLGMKEDDWSRRSLGAVEGMGVVEACPFETVGVMLDVSRNAVLRPDAAKSYLRSFALMGVNTVFLYMEDVYEIEGEPFFGYARGGYSPAELRALDDYAACFGIELIPCIQTLGHLEQILQWPAYRELVDVPGVLFVGDDRVQALIRKMLETLSRCFRSRRIHVGMDEAHGLGQGRYLRLKGAACRFDLFNAHLNAVVGVCNELGLRPMIWSDMFFRFCSREDDYYDVDIAFPEGLAERIPQEAGFVYWDYYHTDPAFYDRWIEKHRSLGKTPLFATGGWSWGRLWSSYAMAFERIGAGMSAARAQALPEVFITLWGDDGAECNPVSVLPCVQFFAECAYGALPGEARLEERLYGASRQSFAALAMAGQLDEVAGFSSAFGNASKWLLWHDPVVNFMGASIPEGASEHYRLLSQRLGALSGGEAGDDIAFARLLSQVLAAKCRLHVAVRPLYEQKDVGGMKSLVANELCAAIAGVEELALLHRKIWLHWYKPFGWEVLERRYGGIGARLRCLKSLLEAWLLEPGVAIEEFEYAWQAVDPGLYVSFARAAFPTVWR